VRTIEIAVKGQNSGDLFPDFPPDRRTSALDLRCVYKVIKLSDRIPATVLVRTIEIAEIQPEWSEFRRFSPEFRRIIEICIFQKF
jgi:hypothetical protein